MSTPLFDLSRFTSAQEHIYAQALAEIKAGAKYSHWMWFIFPQLAGLGSSETAQRYAIKDLDEAQAYLDQPLLGSRLIECCEALLCLKSNSATDILGFPDDMKLRSSMTLFNELPDTHEYFQLVLNKFFGGIRDQRTLELLND